MGMYVPHTKTVWGCMYHTQRLYGDACTTHIGLKAMGEGPTGVDPNAYS